MTNPAENSLSGGTAKPTIALTVQDAIPSSPHPEPEQSPAGGEAFDPDEFRAWYRVVRDWSGSAFIAGEKVADPDEHMSQLYGDLCRLGNHLDVWADMAAALARQAPAPSGRDEREAVTSLVDHLLDDDHKRRCQGREYACECGYDNETQARAEAVRALSRQAASAAGGGE